MPFISKNSSISQYKKLHNKIDKKKKNLNMYSYDGDMYANRACVTNELHSVD
jgi:hypothetical protein